MSDESSPSAPAFDNQMPSSNLPVAPANVSGERAQPLAQVATTTDTIRLPKVAEAIVDDASIRTGTTEPDHSQFRTGTKKGIQSCKT